VGAITVLEKTDGQAVGPHTSSPQISSTFSMGKKYIHSPNWQTHIQQHSGLKDGRKHMI